jgi:hypothetical protein
VIGGIDGIATGKGNEKGIERFTIHQTVQKTMMAKVLTVLEIVKDYDYQGIILSQTYQCYQGRFFIGEACQIDVRFKSLISNFLTRALDAVSMSWDNMHLKNILSSDTYCSHVPDTTSSGSFNSQGQPLWHGKIEL